MKGLLDVGAHVRVLMITPELPSPDHPGSMAPAVRQIESLRALGIEADVVDMRGVPKLKYLQAIPRVRRLVRRADLVHAHFGYCGWLAMTQSRKPIVVSFMGDDLLGTPNAQGRVTAFSRAIVRANRRLARRVNAVIVKSREMARVLAPTEPAVIPNGVDLNAFSPRDQQAARSQLGFAADRKVVLFPGNPANPRKGFALASAAVEEAATRIGDTIQLVPLWGVEPDQVANYMNACDAMLMTSLIEGSPNVVKEAMACNLPVVATPVGDVQELLADVVGCAVCAREASAIGQQLAIALESGARSSGRQAIIDKKLDLASVARRVVDVYEQVLGQETRPERTELTTSPSRPAETRSRELV